MEAALLASREIGFTIISMTISLVAVFIPVLFMGGIVGRLLHEFSVTITVAILISGFVSLTLTPMLGSRFLRYQQRAEHGRLYAAFEARLQGLASCLRLHAEGRAAASVRHADGGGCCCWCGTVYLFMTMPTGFIPSQDSGFMFGDHDGRAGHFVRLHGQASAGGRRRSCSSDPNVQDYGDVR